MKPKTPRRLYKYRTFNVHTLRLLSDAEVYYASPRHFNDPLDCDPTIEIDVDRTALEKLCFRMLADAEGKERALQTIGELRYASTEYGDYKTDPAVERYYMRLCAREIKRSLDQEYSNLGVLSLASRWDSPLMWSHYADQHRGICIEYDLTEHVCRDLQPVRYNNPRSVKTSQLIECKIKKSLSAERRIQNTYFFSKAPQWRYEKEWRNIDHEPGSSIAPFRISGVYFGLRCDPAVQTTIVLLFANSTSRVVFYGLHPLDDGFRLKRRRIDTSEIEACGVRNVTLLDFKEVVSSDGEDA